MTTLVESEWTIVSRCHQPLGKDVCIEILSYLNLIDSNHLAHVNHEFHSASEVERRREVELTYETVRQLLIQKTKGNQSTTTTTPDPAIAFEDWNRFASTLYDQILQSPLARLITQLSSQHQPFQFNTHKSLRAAAINFPNLLHMSFGMVERTKSEPTDNSHTQVAVEPPFTQPFHLPSRLTNIRVYPNVYLTTKEQQIYVDALASATQLQTIYFDNLKPDINYTVLTKLPHLTDLNIYHYPSEPVPDHVLPIFSSLDQLVSLQLGWCILPEQWCHFRLPHLRYITFCQLAFHNSPSLKCSDLVPLVNTVMVKSIRHLPLVLTSCADVATLMELVKFTNLKELDISGYTLNENRQRLTETDIREIHTALIQLKTLTSLKLNYICSTGKRYKLNILEILTASPRLTSLGLHHRGADPDFSFLRSPLAQSRLVELNIGGRLTEHDLLDGLPYCVHLRRLSLYFYGRRGCRLWETKVKVKLNSRQVLPELEQLTVRWSLHDEAGSSDLDWDLWTGSETPNFRLPENCRTTSTTSAFAEASDRCGL